MRVREMRLRHLEAALKSKGWRFKRDGWGPVRSIASGGVHFACDFCSCSSGGGGGRGRDEHVVHDCSSCSDTGQPIPALGRLHFICTRSSETMNSA